MSEYKLVAEWNSGVFSETISRLLQLGWVLHGIPFAHEGQLCQALMRTRLEVEQ